MGYERQLMGDDGLNAAEILYETIDEETGERALPAPTAAALKAATIDKIDAKLIDIDEHLAGSSLELGEAVAQKFGEVDDKLDEVDATVTGKVDEINTAVSQANTATGAANAAAGAADSSRVELEQKVDLFLETAPRAEAAADRAEQSETVLANSEDQIRQAERLAKLIPDADIDSTVVREMLAGDLGKLILAFVDPDDYLGVGLTEDGVLAARRLRALGSILTPLLNVSTGGSVAVGKGGSVDFTGDGRINGATGASVVMQDSNYVFSIADEQDDVLLGLLKDGGLRMLNQVITWGFNSLKTTHANGTSIEFGQHNYDLCIVDDNGDAIGLKDNKWFGFGSVTTVTATHITIALKNGVVLEFGPSNYDFAICDEFDDVGLGFMNGLFYSPIGAAGTVDLNSQDAANKAYSQSVYMRRVTSIQRPTAAYNLQFVYGQSLAQGDETWPALSRANRFGNLQLGGSVQPRNGGSTYSPVGGAVTLQPLAAVTIDNANTLYVDETVTQASGGARGEPVNHAWANSSRYSLGQYLLTEDYTSRRFVSINIAVSGATIGELEKVRSEPVGGTQVYGRFTDAIAKVKAIADGESKSVIVGGIAWLQGEHDYFQASGHTSQNITYLNYRAKFEQVIADMQADAMAITGQALPPAFLSYQTGASYTRDADINGVPGLHIGMAQLDAVLASDTAWMVGPIYPYTDKGGHLDSNGSRWFGHQIAKIHHRVAVEGRDWEPLRPLRIWQEGDRTVYIAYHVPHGPLVFGKPRMASGAVFDQANRGFRVSDSTGDVAVSEAVIVRDTIIRLTCSRALTATPKVWYASQQQGGNGMVRDSDPAVAIDKYVFEPERGMYANANIPELVDRPYPLWNWSVAFYLPVGFKEV